MARNANDTLSSFGVSPTNSTAVQLDFSAMITSLENHRDPIQTSNRFELDDEDEFLNNGFESIADTLDIFGFFHNPSVSTSDLRFSQTFGTFEQNITDSGIASGPSRAPTSLNDTTEQFLNEMGDVSVDQQRLNLSSSWFGDLEEQPIASTFERQPIIWKSNGQRFPSPDIFADSNSEDEESMKPYQIINTDRGICKNVKSSIDALKVVEHFSVIESTVENHSLHTIGPKDINSHSIAEFNSMSNSCAENNGAEEHMVVEETTDALEPTYTTKDKTSGFGTFIYEKSFKESANVLHQESLRHALSHSTAKKPFTSAAIYDAASKKSDFKLRAPILAQSSPIPAPVNTSAANPFSNIVNDKACKETVITFESPSSTHQSFSTTPEKPAPEIPLCGDLVYNLASTDPVVTKETQLLTQLSPMPVPANTLIDKIILNSEEIAALGQTIADIRKNVLCQAVVVKKPPLPTGLINPDLVHSSSNELMNILEKSTSSSKIVNANCRAESSRVHTNPLLNVASNFETLNKYSEIPRDIFQNNCPSIEQSIFAPAFHSLETRPDTNFKRPSDIINIHKTSNLDRNLETDLNEVDMDETFSRTFEESQMHKAMNEAPRVAESTNKLSVDVGLNLDVERTPETVHKEIDTDDTFCRTFEESRFNQAMASQLPYLLNEMHRYEEGKLHTIGQTEKLLSTHGEPEAGPHTSPFDYSATQPIKNTQIAKDFSKCFPKYASQQMKRSNLTDPTGQSLQDFHIAKIELIVLQVLDDLVNQKQIEFVVLKRSSLEDCCFDVGSQTLKLLDSENAQKSRIYGKNRIALLLSVLAEVYRTLKTRITCTKRLDVNSRMMIVQCRHDKRKNFRNNRELYYSDPELTQSQHNVDTTIKDICCILEAKPWELGVFSSSKGLVVGNIKLTLPDDDIIDCNSIAGGITLPLFTARIKSMETNAKFVLLVEKDTVFEKLIQQEVMRKFEGHCIMVTGRGYPDTNTRVFLKKLWDQHHLPIYALFDADPYGIEILHVYSFGSIAMSYTVDELAVPAIQWIGVYPSDIKKLALPSMPMQWRDIARLKELIKRSYISESIFRELLILQTDGRKAEIEALYSISSPLYLIETYLPSRVNILH